MGEEQVQGNRFFFFPSHCLGAAVVGVGRSQPGAASAALRTVNKTPLQQLVSRRTLLYSHDRQRKLMKVLRDAEEWLRQVQRSTTDSNIWVLIGACW